MPHGTMEASNGGAEIVLAQFDFGGSRSVVLRPSFRLGLNGTSSRTDWLKCSTVLRSSAVSTPSSLLASSSSESALTTVTSRILYSLRSSSETLESKICHAKLPGRSEEHTSELQSL